MAVFRIKPRGAYDFCVEGDTPQEALDKYLELLNGSGFEIYHLVGGSGDVGESLKRGEIPGVPLGVPVTAPATQRPSNILIPNMQVPSMQVRAPLNRPAGGGVK